MMRFFAIAMTLFLFACGEREEKVIDLSKRIPKSKRNYDQIDTVAVDPSMQQLKKFQSWNSAVASIRKLERRSFLQRFQPESTEQFVWYFNNGDSLEYERMVFVDSIRTRSAFYNWLDRADISYLGAKESIQTAPFAMMISDTVILRLSGAIDFKFWETFIDEQDWMDEGDHWIKQRKYGKAQWYVREDEELKDLSNTL